MNLDPEYLRDLTWDKIQPFLFGDRQRVLNAFLRHGQGTTRQISQLSGIDLLTLRPRTTELVTLGLIECVGKDGTQGIYRAVKPDRQQAAFERTVRSYLPEQTLLKI